MKQIEVTILGQGYVLGCPEGGEAPLRAAVEAVDREMSAIRDGGRVKARERIAVLAALNVAYQHAQQRPASASASAPAPAAAPTEPAGETVQRSDEPDLDALIRRLDAALGADGHLL
ncbi:MAG: cell division protein ZapA [Rubrivivax sp.]